MEQRESPETDPYKYTHLMFDKGTKAIQQSKDSISTNYVRTGYPHARKKKRMQTELASFTKINSKQITGLNVKHKTIILIEVNIGENRIALGLAITLGTTPEAQSMKERINKLDFTKIKNFCSAKNTVKKMKS